MSELISVIIPAYNAEKYLPKCFECLENQTYTNLEIIIVNDGSTDNTRNLCEEFAQKDSRVIVINKENGGVSSARNAGLDIAKGEYIGFIDADDLIENKYFEILIRNATNNNADISCCAIQEIANDYNGCKTKIYDSFKTNISIEDIRYFYFTMINCLSENRDIKSKTNFHNYVVWAKIIKREFINDLRFDNYNYGEDTLFISKLMLKQPISYYDSYIGYQYVRWDFSATKNPSKFIEKEYSNTKILYLLACMLVTEEQKRNTSIYNSYGSYNILYNRFYNYLYNLLTQNRHQEFFANNEIKPIIKKIGFDSNISKSLKMRLQLYCFSKWLFWYGTKLYVKIHKLINPSAYGG